MGERTSNTVDCTVHVILILMIPHWISVLQESVSEFMKGYEQYITESKRSELYNQ